MNVGRPEAGVPTSALTQQGKYQGARDTKPWDSAPLPAEFRGGTWAKGDQKSWEEQIKNRQLSQHEHKRIYQ